MGICSGAAPGLCAGEDAAGTGPGTDLGLPSSLPRVLVVGSTPLVGSDVPLEDIPVATQVLGAGDVNRTGIPSLTGAILENVPSATINDAEGNVFQPDILFRGFIASPVAGTPQGLAVYVDGARFNDAFGDTVNWDLIPPTAIESINLEASNPVFGLNALGGSVNVRLKTGFSSETESLTAYGGSYGRGAGILEYGAHAGPFALYVAADVTHDDGFRYTSSSDLYRLYTDLGWRSAAAEVHLGITGAHDTLGNPGATPIQALAANIANVFTAPNDVDNQYFMGNLHGEYRFADTTSVQGLAYYQRLSQYVPNGITEEVGACGGGSRFLCNSDGTVVTGANGLPVNNFLDGATYSGLSVQELDSHAYGVSVQATESAPLADRANHLTAGASYDGSDSIFAGSQLIGGFDPYTREFLGPGIVQDQPSEGVNPVRVQSITRFYGLFATDVLRLATNLDLNLAGRFNDARITLGDELGGPVSGHHDYDRLNPGGGLTYRVASWLQVHGSYTETNRAPTPQELSCASAAAPCSLLNFFVGDPNLQQVVARTFEVGARGETDGPARGHIRWSADFYRTQNTNDIIYEATLYNPNLAFYTNAGKTLREGVEGNLHYDADRLKLTFGYAYTDATFRTPLLVNSGSNPAANTNGQIQVEPGDRLPGIPRHRANLVVDFALTHRWNLGAALTVQSDAYRFGDEANLTQPLGGYTLVDLNVAFRPNDRITLFAVLDNALDRRYETYGSFGPIGDVPWPNVPGGVNDPRTSSPGTPIVAYGGARVAF
jgi:outer membrane receptor protein involved in Fe transport